MQYNKADTIILAHAARYPLMQPQDAVKLCYQAYFGAGHMISNTAGAVEYLNREYEQAQPDNSELFEILPGGYARLNLCAAKRAGLSAELIFALFFATAAAPLPEDAPQRFRALLDTLAQLADDGAFEFSRLELEAYLSDYISDEPVPAPVSHSSMYRYVYEPRYRVVDARYAPIIGLCKMIYGKAVSSSTVIMPVRDPDDITHNIRTVIAIDGRCASGKSTAADLIVRAFGAEIVRCDDFFLPPELRTPGRYAEPGGNIHYERFAAEVIDNLATKKPFEYGVYDCSVGRITRTTRVGDSPFIIVEGAYSTHPRFGRYYNLSAFFDVSKETQRERIIAREGENAWPAFERKWIPLEEAYIAATNADKRADIVVRT